MPRTYTGPLNTAGSEVEMGRKTELGTFSIIFLIVGLINFSPFLNNGYSMFHLWIAVIIYFDCLWISGDEGDAVPGRGRSAFGRIGGCGGYPQTFQTFRRTVLPFL